MRRPSIRARLLMKAKPLEIELKGCGENAVKVTHVDLQHIE
jgi:hypothetical protein